MPSEPDPTDPIDAATGATGVDAGAREEEPLPAHDPPPPHDDGGLELARSVARSLANGARALPKRGKSRTGRFRRATRPEVSGAHPDERDPQLLDNTIGRLVAEHGWATDVRVHGVFGRWDQIVGTEVAQHCTPESFGDGKLVVRTDSTAWATQLKLLAPTVVRRLNEELGPDTVKVIDVQGPTGPGWRRGRFATRDGRGPRDTYG